MRGRELVTLAALGIFVEALYYFLLVRPVGLLERWTELSLDFGKVTGYGRQEGLLFLVVAGALFVACVLAWRAVWRRTADGRAVALVFGFAALHAVTLVFAYPLGSTDMVAYTVQSRVLTHHGANPFLVPPSAFPNDPLFSSLTYWFDEPSIYGPVWVFLGSGVALLAGDNLLTALLLFKTVGAVTLLLTAAVAYALIRRWRPDEALAGAVFIAWNPLLVFECAANGHNDIAMALPALLAIWAFAAGRIGVSLVMLMASALVKFVTATLFPAFLWAWLVPSRDRSSRLRSAALGLTLAGLLAVALYLPFWEGLQTIGPLRRGQYFTSSPWAALYFWLFQRGDPNAAQLAGYPPMLAFIAYTVWRSLTVGEGAERLATAAFDITFAYLVLASSWFQPWYLAFLVPFGALAPDEFRRHLALIFSVSATLNYFAFFFLWPWYRNLWDMQEGQNLMATVVFLPPLLYLGIALLRRRSAVNAVGGKGDATS